MRHGARALPFVLALAASLPFAASSHATTITYPVGTATSEGWQIEGSETLTSSDRFANFLKLVGGSAVVTTPFSPEAVGVDTTAGTVLDVTSTGVMTVTVAPSPRNDNYGVTGGSFSFGNFVVTYNADGSADVSGSFHGQSATGQVVDDRGLLFTADAGQRTGNASWFTQASPFGPLDLTVNQLRPTDSTLNHIAGSLGLDPNGMSYTTLQGVQNFGSLSLVVGPALIPEPATWASMGLGLLGLASVARRQRRQPAAH